MTTGYARLAAFAAAVRTFRQDVRGVAAVEFGFIAPVLVLMLLGVIEVTRAVSIDSRISVATNMVADLVAREQQLTKEDVEAIYEVVSEVMAPYDDTLVMTLIPVMSASDNASMTLVYPSEANRPRHPEGAVPPKCQAYSLPAGMLKTNESVIVVETTYEFETLFVSKITEGWFKKDWSKAAYAKPRKSLCVAFDGANCTSSCFPS